MERQETDFKVKEWVALDFIAGFFLLGLFIYSIIYYNTDYTSFQYKVFVRSSLIILIPAVAFLVKGFLNRTVITINSKGIYYYEYCVTNWEDFINAYITEDVKAGSISDDFVLVIEYYYREKGMQYKKTIPLTNTQNKSEEEIIEAVNYYKGIALKNMGAQDS